jgi:DNA polymerase-4
MKNILHIDMNAYFASVEELLHPEFKNKPLIVGGRSKRSVVASANYIARAAGIKAAMPMYRAELICPNAIICIPTFGKYEEYHNKFINLIRKYFSENIETTSIDECYIDVTDISNDKSPLQIAMQIQNMIKSRIGLKCSIGIAHNKLLAKMASDYKKPFGITEMYKEDVIAKL